MLLTVASNLALTLLVLSFLFRMLIVNLPLDKEPAHKTWQDGAKLTMPRFCNSSFHDVH